MRDRSDPSRQAQEPLGWGRVGRDSQWADRHDQAAELRLQGHTQGIDT